MTSPDGPGPTDRAAQIAALERDLAELEASMPAHSVPASLIIRIEELEDKLAALRAEAPSTSKGEIK